MKIGDSHISTYSSPAGNCVKVSRPTDGFFQVQHSKEGVNRIMFTDAEWDAFIAGVKAGEFDRD